MNKNIIYLLLLILIIVVLLIANISGSSKNVNPEKVEEFTDVNNKIDSTEEIKYDDSLIYGLQETYLDQNYAITLNNIEYLDNLFKFYITFENTTKEVINISLNSIVCEVNQQIVDNFSEDIIELNGSEKKEIILECNATREDNVNALYHGKLFDGRDIDIRFKKK